MPGKISWLIKNKVIILQYIGDVTIEEIQKVADYGNPIISGASAPLVHVIVDETQMTDHPKNVLQGVKAMNTTLSNPKLGWLYFVSIPSEVISFVTKMVLSAARTRYRVVDTLDEAKAALMEADSTLPDLDAMDFATDTIPLYEINGDNVTDFQ